MRDLDDILEDFYADEGLISHGAGGLSQRQEDLLNEMENLMDDQALKKNINALIDKRIELQNQIEVLRKQENEIWKRLQAQCAHTNVKDRGRYEDDGWGGRNWESKYICASCGIRIKDK